MRTHTHPHDYHRRPVLPCARIQAIEDAIVAQARIDYGLDVDTEQDERHAAIISLEQRHARIVEEDWPDYEPDPCGPDDRILGS